MNDLINGVSPYLWMPGHKASAYGQAMQAEDEVIDLNEFADENSQVRLYARWVQLTPIDSAEGLQAGSNYGFCCEEQVKEIQAGGFRLTKGKWANWQYSDFTADLPIDIL